MEEVNKKLRDYTDSLNHKEYLEFLKKIAEECMVSKNAIYNWLSGRTRIRRRNLIKISEVVGRDIFE